MEQRSELELRFLAYIACRIDVEVSRLHCGQQTAAACLDHVVKLTHNARELLPSDSLGRPQQENAAGV